MSLLAVALSLSFETAQAPAAAVHITKEEHEAVLKASIATGTTDQPIKASDVLDGRASVAMLHRTKPEPSALIHDRVTETYYILEGSGTIVTGGTLGSPTPTDLTKFNAGMSHTGTRQGGESRRVKPGDIIKIGRAHV